VRLDKEAVLQALDISGFYKAELGELRPGNNGNHQAICPFHDDTQPSLSVDLTRGLFRCFGCGAKGDVFNFFMRRHGCDFKAALHELARLAGLDPETRPKEDDPGLTLEQFATAKKLEVNFLQSYGVKESKGKDGQQPYVVFEYRDIDGKLVKESTRMRFSMGERPKAKRRGKAIPYGLWRIPEMLAEGELIICEGESDSLTAWLYSLPALGLPGKTTTGLLYPTTLDGFKTVYVWKEPGAEDFPLNVARALDGFKVKAMIPPNGVKDLSEAHVRGLNVLALVR
jgi:putative DNA primase/helicase